MYPKITSPLYNKRLPSTVIQHVLLTSLVKNKVCVTGTEARNLLVEVVYQTIRATVAKQKSFI